MSLRGRVCAVTGASSGIGEAIANALADAGASVIGFARRFPPAEVGEPPEPGLILRVGLDISDEAQVRAAFARLQTLDVLVNAAGAATFGPVLDTGVDQLRAMLESHVIGSFVCSREALAQMTGRGGHIIDVNSVAAVRGLPDCAAYAAAKSGQLGFARALREEARAADVRVTSMIVGATDTPLWDRREGFDRSRMLRPQQVAAVAVDIVARPSVAIDEIHILPPAGVL